MLSKIITASVSGIDVERVTVETDFSQGLPFLSLVGLPDATVRESKERIRSAIINSGYVFPLKRITINLSPADTKKSGSHFDLPMAVGILMSMGLIPEKNIARAGFLGELSLDGTVNPIESALALVLGLKEKKISTVYLPYGNLGELLNVEGLKVYGISNFTELIDHLTDVEIMKPADLSKSFDNAKKKPGRSTLDYADVRGQEYGKRAMQISAAGWHDVIMNGPPGAGKSMLASRLPTIMTEPAKDELLEISKIHSIAGENVTGYGAFTERPFRSPHHTVTSKALIGGGANSKPGELSLAHRGILFLDELPEFDRRTLDMLRQPLEDGYINLSRLTARHRYPCHFILVAAMNPCPCGYYGDPTHECICNISQRMRYLRKVSGPLMDRIDLHVNINAVDFGDGELIDEAICKTASSEDLRKDVITAADIQKQRYAGTDTLSNSDIPDNMIDQYCTMSHEAKSLFNFACRKDGISARSAAKLKKISRTIADLSQSDVINELHVAEAISYRPKQTSEFYAE